MQREHRLLEDEGHPSTAHGAPCLDGGRLEWRRAESDARAGGEVGLPRQEPHQRQSERALPRAGWADDAQHLAARELEGHGLEQRSVVAIHPNGEVADAERRRLIGGRCHQAV